MKYYAVRKGINTGIYNSWLECSKNVTGIRGAEFKSFNCIEKAQEFINTPSSSKANNAKKANEAVKESSTSKDIVEIYTDGACKSNGTHKSMAGYGVYYGDGDDRNISRKLKGEIQSNNRAELMGVIEALKSLSSKIKATIYTDSQYVQKGIDIWIRNWKKNNWKTIKGTDVLNKDLWKLLEMEKDKKPLAQIKYVKGHAGIKGNEEADKLAVAGCFLN